jgi:hypothetical protein
MKVQFSFYDLTPLKRANRLSSLEKKTGVFLKGTLGNKILFADYFPHAALGDRSAEEFLTEFKFQDHEYDRKVFHFLLKDSELQKLTPKKIFNHELWDGSSDIQAPTIKYKLRDPEDLNFIKALKMGIKIRLDANAMFTRLELERLMKEVPAELRKLIEYLEDPFKDKDWSNLSVTSARDFIEGEPFEYYIYKPNCEFHPKNDKQIIYSSYLGGNLGRYHSYSELVSEGDLKETHGIHTEGFYNEEIPFLTGNYKEGLIADKLSVAKIYNELSSRRWSELCSM